MTSFCWLSKGCTVRRSQVELHQRHFESMENEGVKTLGDVQARDQRRKPPAGQQPKRSAADDYDEIFGELLGGSTT